MAGLQILFFLLAVFAVTPLLGGYMARVFTRQRTWLDPVLRPLERLVYRLTGVDETREMRWTEYAVAVLLFSVVSMLVLYAMQRLQRVLPFNPQGLGRACRRRWRSTPPRRSRPTPTGRPTAARRP